VRSELAVRISDRFEGLAERTSTMRMGTTAGGIQVVKHE